MQQLIVLSLFLVVLFTGCDSTDPLGASVDYQTENVYFEGNLPSDHDVAVSYGAYDQRGRSMDYIISLRPDVSARGDVAAGVYLPTTIDSLRTSCVFSFDYSEPDLTFYLEFDSDGLLRGESVFDIPYPSGADISHPYHRVHFGDVVRISGSASIHAGRQDGSESEEARREQRTLREQRNEAASFQTNHVYFGGTVTDFRSYSAGYRAYDKSGHPHTYGITFMCGSSRCLNGEVSVGLLMPKTLDSLSALSGPMPGYDQTPYDHTFALTFDSEGMLRGDQQFTVPYPEDANVDPNVHTLHFEGVVKKPAGELPMVCRQDGSEMR